jgi:hypothetical protein
MSNNKETPTTSCTRTGSYGCSDTPLLAAG